MSLAEELEEIASEIAARRAERAAFFDQSIAHFRRLFPELQTTITPIKAGSSKEQAAMLFEVRGFEFALTPDSKEEDVSLLIKTSRGWWTAGVYISPETSKRKFAELIFKAIESERQEA